MSVDGTLFFQELLQGWGCDTTTSARHGSNGAYYVKLHQEILAGFMSGKPTTLELSWKSVFLNNPLEPSIL